MYTVDHVIMVRLSQEDLLSNGAGEISLLRIVQWLGAVIFMGILSLSQEGHAMSMWGSNYTTLFTHGGTDFAVGHICGCISFP